VVKFVETFDSLNTDRWAYWRGAGTLNIIETVDGKLHLSAFYQALNGYVAICSVSPYYLANNGVEIDFEVEPESVGRLVLSIAPYKIRAGIPEFVLRNYDAAAFEIGKGYSHCVEAVFARGGARTTISKPIPSKVFSGKLRIANKNNVTSCYFDDMLISSSPQLSNMNVAVFIHVFPYYDMYLSPRFFGAYIDTLTIDDISVAALSTQWTDILWLIMFVTTLMIFISIIKKIGEIRK